MGCYYSERYKNNEKKAVSQNCMTFRLISRTMSLDTLVMDMAIISIESFNLYLQMVSVRVFTSLLLAILIWRFWKFTLHPILNPDHPKEYPYWIPCKYSTLESTSKD
jgi:hypothetical protein